MSGPGEGAHLTVGELASIVASVTGRPAAAVKLAEPGASLADIGVTSLHFFRLITVLEDRLGIELADDDIDPARFATVSKMHDMLARYGVALEG